MRITLEKASGRAICRRGNCAKKPEYISDKGTIIKGTTCAWISISSAGGGASACYCRDCIDIIYDEMKKILNPKLWVFH